MHAANDNLLQDAAAGTAGEPAAQNPQVRTLLLTDLCDSTMLVERLGDNAAAELFREHDRLVLGLQQRWRGRLIDRSDGLLLLFERAIDGLGFALDYARGLRELGERREVAKHGVALQARQGLHVGEVLTWRNSDAAVSIGAKPLEVEGLAKPMAGRLMTLARPGQILLSATAEPLAHRAARELGERGDQLLWKDWGRWRFKGVPQAQQVYEVGEPGIAPLRAPQQNRAKAWRDIPLWRRPAALAAELLLVAGLVGGAWFLTRPQPAIAFEERDWVVVGDLRNLTGDTLLDDSLQQAFRISLEQSRYVNVLSDLKARDTLERMRRKPGTLLDRSVASEVALRDGARAVILPTVAEIGGRVRVSAEVIDPQTQTTVYAASADGSGAGSALGSIDKVTSELRGKLGEALESIQKNSVSLPNVTTSNLDALKAYAVGQSRRAEGDRKSALNFYQRAVQLDPNFALAHLAIAGALEALGDLSASGAHYQRAIALRDHLPPRESLLLDAMTAARVSKELELQRWREVASLYPDTHEAYFQLALVGIYDANRYRGSLASLEPAISAQSPFRARALYLKGMVLLGLERVDEAIGEFARSKAAGYEGAGIAHALAYVARGDYAGANNVLAARKGTGSPLAELEARRFRAYVAVDRGDWATAHDEADAGLQQAIRIGSPIPIAEWRNHVLAVAVASAAIPAEALAPRISREVSQLLEDAALLDAAYPRSSAYMLLGAGYAAARIGSADSIERVIAKVKPSDVEGFPTLEQMRLVLLAERERLQGRPQKAIELLSPMAGEDEATVPVHAALLSAARAAGNRQLASRETGWLALHRGRELSEEGVDSLPTPFNIVDGNLARKSAAGKAGLR